MRERNHQLDEDIYLRYIKEPSPENQVVLARMLRRVAMAILWRKVDQDEEMDCRELADEAVALAFRDLSKFRGESKFTSYYYRLVINCWKKWFSRIKARQIEIQMDFGVVPERPSGEASPYLRLLLEDVRELLEPSEQKLFDLKYEGYTDREICAKRGLPCPSRSDNEVYREWNKLKMRLRKLILGDGVPLPSRT